MESTIRQRRQSGLGSAELAIGAMSIAVSALLSVNIIVVMVANSTLDRAARDAARAAAAQPNGSAAYNAALGVLATHKTDGVIIAQPKLVAPAPPTGTDEWTTNPNFVYEDYGGNPTKIPPAYAPPYVNVTTMTTVKLPSPISFLGASFNSTSGATGMPGYIDLYKSYNFPIINFSLGATYQ